MSKGLYGVRVDEVDDHNLKLKSGEGEGDVSSPIFDLSALSAEDREWFQELLSGEPSEFCPKKWAREE